MNSYLYLLAIITIAIQIYFSFLVKHSRQRASREITAYIKNLYEWLPKITMGLYAICFTKKFMSVPVEVPLIDAERVLFVAIFTTLLLSFYPLKLTANLIQKLKLEV
ncbi:MAG: hypothetical protein HYS23_09365 [Geobacter sp.]|nr:hypothetical protein [Geobacter sp.]